MTIADYRERPMTPDERLSMETEVKHLGGGFSLVQTAFVVFMILFLAGVAVVALFDLDRLWGRSIAAMIAAYFALRVYFRMRRSLGGSPFAALLREDLAEGVAYESSFDVVDAIQRAELEDEGAHFYLKLADGRVVFLSGQYLEEPAAEHRFPSSRVVIVHAARSGLLLRLECAGAYVPPSATLPAFTLEELDGDDVPQNGEVLQIDFDALRVGDPR
jgi:hypothetical protein